MFSRTTFRHALSLHTQCELCHFLSGEHLYLPYLIAIESRGVAAQQLIYVPFKIVKTLFIFLTLFIPLTFLTPFILLSFSALLTPLATSRKICPDIVRVRSENESMK